MPTLKTPLVGSFDTRDFNASQALDQRFQNCIFRRIVNRAMQTATWFTEKRPGLDSAVSITSGSASNIFTSPSLSALTGLAGTFTPAYAMTFGALPATVWFKSSAVGTVSCGSIGLGTKFMEAIFSTITYMFFGDGGAGYFLPSDSMGSGSGIPTFTGLRTSGSAVVTSVSSTSGCYVGQALSGTGIQAATRIQSIDSATQITMTLTASSGSATSTTFTREAIAKVVDSDFPTIISGIGSHPFAELDGYVFCVTADRKIYNLDLNSPSSITAGNFIQGNITTAPATGIFKFRNKIVLFKKDGIEFFYNAGNAAGSPLSSDAQLASGIGAPYSSCIIQTPDNIYWIAQDNCLWRFNGFQPEKIPHEGAILGADPNNTGPNITFGGLEACVLYGQPIIHVNASDPSFSRTYFPESGMWSNQLFIGPSAAAENIALGGCYGPPMVVTAGSISNGKSFRWGGATTAAFTDNSNAYTMSIQIQTDMATNKRKFATELRVIADVQASGSLAVSSSDDDGVTFSTARNIALTSIAAMKLNRLGSWKGTRVWKFEHSANTAFRAKMIEIDYKLADE